MSPIWAWGSRDRVRVPSTFRLKALFSKAQSGSRLPASTNFFIASLATRCRFTSRGDPYFRRERAGSYLVIRTSRVRRTRQVSAIRYPHQVEAVPAPLLAEVQLRFVHGSHAADFEQGRQRR